MSMKKEKRLLDEFSEQVVIFIWRPFSITLRAFSMAQGTD